MSWLHTFWFDYWWSSIKGNAPEDVTSLIIVGILSAILIPAVRHWFEQLEQRIKDHVTAQHDELHAHLHHLTDQMGLEKFERKK